MFWNVIAALFVIALVVADVWLHLEARSEGKKQAARCRQYLESLGIPIPLEWEYPSALSTVLDVSNDSFETCPSKVQPTLPWPRLSTPQIHVHQLLKPCEDFSDDRGKTEGHEAHND